MKGLVGLVAAFCCQPAWADTFVLPLGEDGAFHVELDWNGKMSLSEMRLSTGERSPPYHGKSLWLDPAQPDAKMLLGAIFADLDKALTQVNCHHLLVVVVCKNAKNLAVKARSATPGSPAAFQTASGYLWCIEGLAGPGPCNETRRIDEMK